LGRLRSQHFPELPELNATEASESLTERLKLLESKRKQLDELRQKLKDLEERKRMDAGGAPSSSVFEEV
jgi:hypothetical protein